ncbi:hypothetical protein [Streptomyces sp. ACT015]|uniref:hypothetical protein n=1 Tax=Streptomyces sp. ACT015 TaxID=3134807 RepID=UPI003D166F32
MQPFIDLDLDLDRALGTLDALPGPGRGRAPRPAASPGTCPSPRCGGRLLPRHDEDGTTVCPACSDLAEEHDLGAHDPAPHEYCPACTDEPTAHRG